MGVLKVRVGGAWVDLGMTTGPQGPAGADGALGTVGYAQITSDTAAVTAVTDVPGLTVTWTAVAGRRYRTSVNGVWTGSNGGDLLIAQITDGSGNIKFAQHRQVQSSVAIYEQLGCSVVETGLSGSITRKLQHYRYSGGGTSQFRAGATYPAYILVEDIGV